MTHKQSKHSFWDYLYLSLFVIVSLTILFFAAQSGDNSSEQSGTLVNITAKILTLFRITLSEGQLAFLHNFIRKAIGHFLLFMVDGIFAWLSARAWLKLRLNMRFIVTMSAGIFIAALSEILQLFAPERGPALGDVFLDIFGFFIGILLIYLLLKIINHKNKKASL